MTHDLSKEISECAAEFLGKRVKAVKNEKCILQITLENGNKQCRYFNNKKQAEEFIAVLPMAVKWQFV